MRLYRPDAEFVQKFMRDIHEQEVSLEEIWSVPYWEQVWSYWVARQHYGLYKIEMSQASCRKIYGD